MLSALPLHPVWGWIWQRTLTDDDPKPLPPQVYYSASLQKQRIQDAMTQGLYEKTRDSQEVRRRSSCFLPAQRSPVVWA